MVELPVEMFLIIVTTLIGLAGSAIVWVWSQAKPYIDESFVVLNELSAAIKSLGYATDEQRSDINEAMRRIEDRTQIILDQTGRIERSLRVAIEAHKLDQTSAGLQAARMVLRRVDDESE